MVMVMDMASLNRMSGGLWHNFLFDTWRIVNASAPEAVLKKARELTSRVEQKVSVLSRYPSRVKPASTCKGGGVFCIKYRI